VLLDDHTAAGELAKALNTKPTTGVESANINSSENEPSASGSHSSDHKISSEYGKQGDLAKPDPSTIKSSRQDQIKLGIARELICRNLNYWPKCHETLTSGLLRTVWFPISGSLISHITPYCATHLVGTIPNKEHPAVVIDNCV